MSDQCSMKALVNRKALSLDSKTDRIDGVEYRKACQEKSVVGMAGSD